MSLLRTDFVLSRLFRVVSPVIFASYYFSILLFFSCLSSFFCRSISTATGSFYFSIFRSFLLCHPTIDIIKMTRISVSHGECQDTSSRIRSSIRNCNWENKKKKQRNTNNTSISMDTRSVFVLFLLTVVVVCWCGGSAVILVPSIEAFLLSSTTSSASSSSSILLLKYENNDADTDDHTIGDRHRGVAVSRRTVFTETAAAATAAGSSTVGSVFGRSSTNLIRAGLSFGTATATAAGCCGACLRPQLAYGMAQLTTPSFEQTQLYDLPRNALQGTDR